MEIFKINKKFAKSEIKSLKMLKFQTTISAKFSFDLKSSKSNEDEEEKIYKRVEKYSQIDIN
ncbi:hypothetical protein BpHYR1_023776 [Brachionus plicatilis]|uniref:Uncharacterized protein n=1 Tax=Brachionus plicatilis TaxID=10195 RepID=A0A3M7SMK4_BRAPC|nr:hypothetical protein BpHYR1_023776 [Brachionus plicatilis]